MTGIMWECTECGATRLGLFYPDGTSLAVEDTEPGDTRELRCSGCSEGEYPDSDDVVTEHVAFAHDRGTRVGEGDLDE